MGDRVRIQIHKSSSAAEKFPDEISPVFYGHSSGYETPKVLARLKARMASRPGDVAYTFARLVQEFTGNDEGNLSFGVDTTPSLDGRVRLLKEEDSHGDAGCVIIHLEGTEKTPGRWRCECMGGYLKPTADGQGVKVSKDDV